MTDDLQDCFRRNLREYMARQGIRWSSLAAELRISTSYLNNVMTGDKRVSPEFVQRVADVFRLPLTMLVPGGFAVPVESPEGELVAR